MDRRSFLGSALAGAAFVTVSSRIGFAAGSFEVMHSDAEWRAMLSKAEYKVMRKEGTERSGSSPLDRNYAAGTYHCRGCDLPIYSSKAKFDSGTGWPSFWQSLPNAVSTKPDRGILACAPRCIAAGAEAIWVIFSTTAPSQQANAIA